VLWSELLVWLTVGRLTDRLRGSAAALRRIGPKSVFRPRGIQVMRAVLMARDTSRRHGNSQVNSVPLLRPSTRVTIRVTPGARIMALGSWRSALGSEVGGPRGMSYLGNWRVPSRGSFIASCKKGTSGPRSRLIALPQEPRKSRPVDERSKRAPRWHPACHLHRDGWRSLPLAIPPRRPGRPCKPGIGLTP
jgi:hypothetical protein